MKVCLSWLKDFVDIENLDVKKIADALTMSGTKVEEIKKRSGKISNIVVGKVISIKKHENAEKLVICKVLVGENKTLDIVTGATNVVENSFVPVCLENATIFNGTKIKHQKLRGVLSQGMMCSLAELGLSVENFPYAIEDGIFLIEEECEIGQDIKSALFLDDFILEFEITSNRPDCLSVFGIAREIAANFSLPLKKNNYSNLENLKTKNSSLDVKILTPNCSRYMACLVENVEIKPSPLWIRNRLVCSGVKPINNIVDITNYTMLELGVAMHAFDLKKLNGNQIIVKNAQDGEKIKTLDLKEHLLKEQDILICNQEKPLAIAGKIGGEESGVDSSTKSVVFEVACFNGETVRKTSQRLKIKTESAIRFEKNLNPQNCEQTMKRALNLTLCLKAGEVLQQVKDVKNYEEKTNLVELNKEKINSLLGLSLTEKEMISILNSLEFEVENNKIKVPSFRIDIKNTADIAEEIARIYGYFKIPSAMPKTVTTKTGLFFEQQLERTIKNSCVFLGLFEAYSWSIVNPNVYKKAELNKEEILKSSVEIKNPFGEEKSFLRRQLKPFILNSLALNFKNNNETAALFEIGKIYLKNNDNSTQEKKKIAIGIYGDEFNFFSLKGMITKILDAAFVKDFEFKEKTTNFFHPYACCEVLKNGEVLGIFGEVKPTVLENFKINKKAFVAELDFEQILKNSLNLITYKPLSKFPALKRDLCFICDFNLPAGEIEKIIKNNTKDILEKVEIFDVYYKELLEKNKKSISFRLILRGKEKTLTDDFVNSKIKKLLSELEKINVFLRNSLVN